MNKNDQMEIRFEVTSRIRPHAPRTERRRRAQWWFQQMRRVVDSALDWKPAPQPRPEQIYFTLARGR